MSGKISVDKLRLKLNKAIKKNDPVILEKVIAECVGSGHSELISDIQEARLHLESLEPQEESIRGSSLPLSLSIIFRKFAFKVFLNLINKRLKLVQIYF